MVEAPCEVSLHAYSGTFRALPRNDVRSLGGGPPRVAVFRKLLVNLLVDAGHRIGGETGPSVRRKSHGRPLRTGGKIQHVFIAYSRRCRNLFKTRSGQEGDVGVYAIAIDPALCQAIGPQADEVGND